jgi:hypothetical protein
MLNLWDEFFLCWLSGSASPANKRFNMEDVLQVSSLSSTSTLLSSDCLKGGRYTAGNAM